MRRRWIAAAVAILLIVVGGVAWYWNTDTATWERAQVIPVAGMQPGTVIQGKGVFVARLSDGDYRAFLARNVFFPDRALIWDADRRMFVEPISSAQNSIDGTPVSGPADFLYRVDARLQGDTLLVRPDLVISGGHQGDPGWLQWLKVWFQRLTGHDPSAPSSSPPARPAP